MEEFKYGIDYGSYDNEIIEEMYKKRLCGIPLSFFFLDLRKPKSFCHDYSAILSCFFDDFIRVEGSLEEIKSENNRHSWVENEDWVYDVSDGIKWAKASFYKRYKPINIRRYTKEESLEYGSEYLKYEENLDEYYVGFIRDIERNIDEMLYGKYLKDHIKRFTQEKKLEEKQLDEALVEECMSELEKVYKGIEEFLNEDSPASK